MRLTYVKLTYRKLQVKGDSNVIPALGYEAVYEIEGSERTDPIVAWSESGTPQVIGGNGRLQDASTIKGFKMVVPSRMPREVIPGDGWMVTYTAEDNIERTTPVVAWVIDSVSHTGSPLIRRDDFGIVTIPLSIAGIQKWRVWHPNEATSDAAADQ